MYKNRLITNSTTTASPLLPFKLTLYIIIHPKIHAHFVRRLQVLWHIQC